MVPVNFAETRRVAGGVLVTQDRRQNVFDSNYVETFRSISTKLSGMPGNGGQNVRYIDISKHTCVALPTFLFFLPNLRSNRQLDAPLPLIFSRRIFRHSAPAPNFSIDPFGKADMGFSVHSFEGDLVDENWECGFRRLDLQFILL